MRRSSGYLVRLPEGVEFGLPLAGPVVRFLAVALDALILFAVVSLLQSALSILALISLDWFMASTALLSFVLSPVYYILTEWFLNGQSFGKRVLRLRVMDGGGLPLTFSQVMVRNLLRTVDMVPLLYLLGGIVCLSTRHRQRLGDLAAGTVVVRQRDTTAAKRTSLEQGEFNSLRADPTFEARLREAIGVDEANLLVEALSRRQQLDPEARVALYREIVEYLRDRIQFPEELVEELPDEQLLRNVLDTVHRFRNVEMESTR